MIHSDPPWSIGLDLDYPTLKDQLIFMVPFLRLQTDGYLSIWIINMKESLVKSELAKLKCK